MTGTGSMLSAAISTKLLVIQGVIHGQCKFPFHFENKVKPFLTFDRAYNDILYLCEKYAPLESLEKYDPEKDLSVTGAYPTSYVTTQLA